MRQYVAFRSDTVARPTAEMRDAIAKAEVGDDFYGEDPTVNQLQERVAALLGKEKALFLPSGTMANLVAIAAHTQPGQAVICDDQSHVFNSEAGISHWLGIQLQPIQGQRGVISASQVEAVIRHDSSYGLQIGLIVLENPHNRGGGVIYPFRQVEQIHTVAKRYGLPMHLDGARLLNAAIASGIAPDQLSTCFDSVYFCLSKGLGCPVGAVLAGSAEFIRHAAGFRLAFGGSMCQVGMLAAAGLWALDCHLDRLAEDHRRARHLAVQLADLPVFAIDLESVQTNIVMLDIRLSCLSAVEVAAELEQHGIQASVFGARRLRLVTHLEIDDRAIEYTVSVFKTLFQTVR